MTTIPNKMFVHKIFFACAVLCLAACNRSAPPPGPQKPLILVSIAPYQFLAERVAGKDFTVQSVSPLGADPHTYEPTSKQVAAIGRGSVWFLLGEPFEKKLLSVLKLRNPSLVEADLLQGIVLLDDPSFACAHCCVDRRDRHTWLSPKTAALQAQTIALVLAERFPEHKEIFLENAKLLQIELANLDREISSLLAPVKDRVFLVSHPSFGYFCRDYQLTQLSIEYEGKEPRPKHLEEVLQQALSQGAKLALALPQHNNKGAERIAQKLHLPVQTIDPYSANYFETMHLLAELIADPQHRQ